MTALPAKTRSNHGGADRSEAVAQGTLTASSGFGRKRQKTEGASKYSKQIKSMFKLQASYKALEELMEKECDAEEQHYGPLPDRPVSHPFMERQFGDLVTHDVSRHFPCDVVSIALFDGDTKLFACSGLPLPQPSRRPKLDLARYVTTARFATEYKAKRYRDDKLRIEVRLPDGEKIGGLLELYNRHIAIVTLLDRRTDHPVDLKLPAGQCSIDYRVTVAGRAFGSCCLMTAKVDHQPDWADMRRFFPLTIEAFLGGPVLGEDNMIMGMSIEVGNDDRMGTAASAFVSYLPLPVLCRYLKHFQILERDELHFRGYLLPDRVHTLVPSGFMRRINRIKHYGYPMPPPLMLELNAALLNRFEECFGETLAWKGYPFPVRRASILGVWKQIRKDVARDISRRVVSIASFHGYERYFACTGLHIKWHGRTVVLTSASLVRSCDNEEEIDNSLKIEVLLPPNQRASGKLEFYNLNYNIAIVSVQKKFISVCPEDIFIKASMPKLSAKVVAVGREPRQGLLIASIGEVKRRDKDCELDCKDLMLSTCNTKKAGIGGPLINFYGSFVGMNFYDGRSLTPFLPRSKIVQVLGSMINLPFPSERGDGPMHFKDAGGEQRENRILYYRWPVPELYWYHGRLDVDYAAHEHVGRRLH
ncbi:unnamed protein product [Alopecurus aequalis]